MSIQKISSKPKRELIKKQSLKTKPPKKVNEKPEKEKKKIIKKKEDEKENDIAIENDNEKKDEIFSFQKNVDSFIIGISSLNSSLPVLIHLLKGVCTKGTKELTNFLNLHKKEIEIEEKKENEIKIELNSESFLVLNKLLENASSSSKP